MEGSSAFQFGRAAYRHGLISRGQLMADARANILFRLRGSTDGGTEALRDRISEALAGVRVRDLERLGADILAGILPRLYRPVLEIAYHHQDEGRAVYIVTAAADDLAQVLAHVLAFDGAIGTRFSTVEDGVYTGRPGGAFIYRTGKADAIRALAAAEGFDLAECYAYSDSESDLPMLAAVGHPVVVNPDKDLLRRAREDGWEVLRFDRLGRRLYAALGLGVAALVGGIVSLVLVARDRAQRLELERLERERLERETLARETLLRARRSLRRPSRRGR